MPAVCWAYGAGCKMVNKIVPDPGSLSILHPEQMGAIIQIITQINMYSPPLVSVGNWFQVALGTKTHRCSSPLCKMGWSSRPSVPKKVESADAELTGMEANCNYIPLQIEIRPQDERDTIS